MFFHIQNILFVTIDEYPIHDSLSQQPKRVMTSGSATLGRKPSSGIPKWSASPGKDSASAVSGMSEAMTRSTLSRQCVLSFRESYSSR